MKKKIKAARPAYVNVLAELVSCNTDPVQYKPYNPHLQISGDKTQTVLVRLQVPSEEIESDKKVGKKRVIIITAEGMALMLKRLASDIAAAVALG